MDIIPTIPVDEWITAAINWLVENLAPLWDFISIVFAVLDGWFQYALLTPPAIALILSGGVLALLRSWKFAIFAVLALALVDAMGMWKVTMQTLALVLIAGVFALALAIPVGIVAARSDAASAAIRPALDFMQTLHPFAYLVPIVVIFGIGAVPGIVATVIFGMPPGVRLTELGIRQVDKEIVEAGEAFGAGPRQVLARIQLPLALPTIMAGVNQLIMLCLSMSVLAGLVGAQGLGTTITFAISRVNVGVGMEAGIAIVVLAIFLDRLTGALGQRSAKKRATAG